MRESLDATGHDATLDACIAQGTAVRSESTLHLSRGALRTVPEGLPALLPRGGDDLSDYEDHDTREVILLPGWRASSGKLHIRKDCRAVTYHRRHMTPVLVRLDDDREVSRVLGATDELCGYCFSGL